MRARGTSARAGAVAVALPLLFASCSLKVTVRDDWDDVFKRPIPIAESTRTWQKLQAGGELSDSDLRAYNETVRDAIVQIANWTPGEDREAVLRTTGGAVGLGVVATNLPALSRIEEILPADYVRVKRGLRNASVVEGVGAPLIVRIGRTEADPLIPESGLWQPVSALLNLDQPDRPVLELIDPTKQSRISQGGRDLPLSANFTAAFARDFQDRQFHFQSLSGLLRFEQFADRIGIYRVTPFDPGKETVVFIHGINSSPSTWDEVINRLYGDAAIRERYEFWTFGYPTGAPIPYMASRFREAVREMIAFRASNGAKSQRITIVGHSMGGLLAKSLTLSSGDEEWRRLFTVPVDELKVAEEDREMLRSMIYFEPVPEVKRIVFCATPHRGAEIAGKPLGRLVGDLIQVPNHILKLSTSIIAQSAYALTPEGMNFARDRLTSIEQLGSDAWTTVGFLNKPLNPSVTYHSLIGSSRGSEAPLERTSDNIVPYASSHLEGVASEKVVPRSNHGVHRKDEGIDEISRILRLP